MWQLMQNMYRNNRVTAKQNCITINNYVQENMLGLKVHK